MSKGSKLFTALDRHKGVNHRLEKQKKLQKQAAKRKRLREQQNPPSKNSQVNGIEPLMSGALQPEEDDGSEWESENESDTAAAVHNAPPGNASNTGGKGEDQEIVLENSNVNNLSERQVDHGDEDEADESPDNEAEEGIPLSDIESLSEEEKGDIIPHQRLTINNATALTKAYDSIALPISKLPFSEHQTIVSATPISIPDVNDDLNRELVFHQQCLTAVKEARDRLKKEGVLFSRPADYFAEMVKSDEHMGKIKHKMTVEAANKKAAAEARKQRDLKKFGKQVQVAKLQERDKAKRETLDKINILKRKRKNADVPGAEETDMFDVALEDASKADRASKRPRTSEGGRGPNKRSKKDAKYGFGGKKRFAKSGDAVSSSDLRGFSTQKMKGQKKSSQRLGKSRRAKRT
ncbi:MAG: hypothetical protein LQ343_008008 [Gyalolechia ehrenbergii]|nr:MAG: hypothetical protein LQ343_008008 [Gyalolechia ehrenbergii]